MGQLEDMAVFVRIVEAGGIGKASEQLNIAKSAVSRRLTDIETKFKKPLLNRTTRSWSLTETGESYYLKAKEILEEVSNLNAEIQDQSSGLAGTLRITVPMSFGIQHLNSILDMFSRRHPELKFQLDVSDRQVDLVEEGYELAVRIADLESSSLRARLVAPIHHVLVASPSYIDQTGGANNHKQLEKLTFLRYSLSKKSSIELISPKNEKIMFSPDSKITANNAELLKDMAVKGHGVSYLPSFHVYEEIRSKRLQQILPDYTLPSLGLYVVYPNSRYLSQKARAFIDFVAEHCGSDPYWDEGLNVP